MGMIPSVLICPIMSEKSNQLGESFNKYVFKVEKKANKLEIKKSVEEKFKVKVKKIATINQRGKIKNISMKSGGRVIRTSGYRSGFKKAIVTLMEGHSIDLVGGEV